MSTINTNYKADSVGYDPATDQSNSADLRQRLEDALRELEQFKEENATWLSEENLREMERMEVFMKAEVAAIDAYGQGGFAPGEAGPGWGTSWDAPTDLVPGWNVPENGTLRITEDSADAALLDDPSTYAGTVNFESSSGIGFSLQDDNIQKVEMDSIGKDLALTITYEDGTKETWVIKDGSVRSENIYIDATRMNHGVTIDASGALRIADGKHGVTYGTVQGFQVWGSDYDDKIYGSQGTDGIVAMGGNDTIDGMAGDDVIFGDDQYGMPGEYATDVNGVPAGDDDIRGGAGSDTIYGGAGIDTGYASDATSATNPDYAYDMGGEIRNDMSNAPDPSGWLSNDDNWEVETDEDGTIVLKHTGDEGGQIDIEIPEGYTMAFAEKDAEDRSLVITFVGQDEDGNPTTFKLRIEGFFDNIEGMDPSAAVITLNVFGSDEGDIIDFSRITGLEHQNVNIYGMGGNDFILGVDSALARDGIDIANWSDSTASDGELNRYNEWGILAGETEGWNSEVSEDGMIVVTRDSTAEEVSDTVIIAAPDGYDHGYITTDGTYTYVILVNDEGDTIVVKFEDSDLDYTKIFVWDRKPERASEDEDPVRADEIRLIPIDFDAYEDWNTIDGGEGRDVLFGLKGSNFVNDGSDFVVKGTVREERSFSESEVETPETPEPPEGEGEED